MIFVFAEDATLHVVDGIDDVRRMCEPIDVESGVFAFYNEGGQPLEPTFTKPNREKRVFGLLSSVEQGEFDLVAASDSMGDPISVALAETASVEPNPWFENLDAVKRYLAGRGAL